MERTKELNLQLFAEETEEATEEVVEEEVETTDEDNEEVEFDEGAEEAKEEKSNEEAKAKELEKQKNRANAQRRIQEKHERELKEAKDKAYLEGLKQGVGGKNPYTGEEIKDEVDLELLKTMQEMERKGLDPIEDFAKYQTQKRREELKAEQEKKAKDEENQQAVQKELDDFDKKYGKGSAENLFKDEKFKEKYGKFLGRLTLEETYQLFIDSQAEIETKVKEGVEEGVIKQKAIEKSSPGVPGNKNANESYFDEILKDDKKFREFQQNLLNKY